MGRAPIWALTLAGVGYGVAIDLVESVSGGLAAGGIGFQKIAFDTGSSATVNKAQDAVARALIRSAEATQQRNITRLYKNVMYFAAQTGPKLRKLRSIPGLDTRHLLTQTQYKTARKQGKQMVRANQNLAARQGSSLRWTSRLAAGIGLYFMRADLARALGNIAKEFE